MLVSSKIGNEGIFENSTVCLFFVEKFKDGWGEFILLILEFSHEEKDILNNFY
jgi:hypothetical protein